jgi:hypothetical protein
VSVLSPLQTKTLPASNQVIPAGTLHFTYDDTRLAGIRAARRRIEEGASFVDAAHRSREQKAAAIGMAIFGFFMVLKTPLRFLEWMAPLGVRDGSRATPPRSRRRAAPPCGWGSSR